EAPSSCSGHGRITRPGTRVRPPPLKIEKTTATKALELPDQATQVTASVHLELADEDRAAVKELLTAIRAQAATDTLTRQRTETLARELAHPAALLARWLQQPDAQITKPPSEAELEALARRLRGYPKDRDEPLELQLLDVLRDFLAEFPKEEQKRLLVVLLANGMRAARKPGHADRAEALVKPAPWSGVTALAEEAS
ncbi:hypothetical protein ACFFRO_08725, partial [Streptomyces thermocoprophilus]